MIGATNEPDLHMGANRKKQAGELTSPELAPTRAELLQAMRRFQELLRTIQATEATSDDPEITQEIRTPKAWEWPFQCGLYRHEPQFRKALNFYAGVNTRLAEISNGPGRRDIEHDETYGQP